jgi:triosephosphate isomerase
MHGTVASVGEYVRDLELDRRVEVVVFPPAVYLAQLADLAPAGMSVGSQDVGEFEEGAHTGEVAAAMIRDVGGRWTLAGHSERRQDQGESDDLVARKVTAALRADLMPLLCVGETLAEREAGIETDVVARQLDAALAAAGHKLLTGGAIAYEPVWAIGTGRTASPGQAQDMHAFIRAHVARADAAAASSVRILYGGSVKPDNAGELFAQADIDGGLVGGASLDAEQFSAIIAAATL